MIYTYRCRQRLLNYKRRSERDYSYACLAALVLVEVNTKKIVTFVPFNY
jgi:hypothetical protein